MDGDLSTIKLLVIVVCISLCFSYSKLIENIETLIETSHYSKLILTCIYCFYLYILLTLLTPFIPLVGDVEGVLHF